MLQKGEFDICELSLSSYLMAKSRGMPFTAIPVFPRRLFSLSQMWVNVDAKIVSPHDLIGKRVGLSTFQTTLSVLAKGDLQSEYDVPWRHMHWIVSKEEAVPFKRQEGVHIELIAAGKKIGAMLEQGEIDALMVPHPPKEALRGSPTIRRLFADPKQEEAKYFRKNGYYPIMHVVAFKDEVLAKNPSVAQSVAAALIGRRKHAWLTTTTPTGRALFGAGIFSRKNEEPSAQIPGPTASERTGLTWSVLWVTRLTRA
jgi:4,5-dihydroxyphthalate decarboxylase